MTRDAPSFSKMHSYVHNPTQPTAPRTTQTRSPCSECHCTLLTFLVMGFTDVLKKVALLHCAWGPAKRVLHNCRHVSQSIGLFTPGTVAVGIAMPIRTFLVGHTKAPRQALAASSGCMKLTCEEGLFRKTQVLLFTTRTYGHVVRCRKPMTTVCFRLLDCTCAPRICLACMGHPPPFGTLSDTLCRAPHIGLSGITCARSSTC